MASRLNIHLDQLEQTLKEYQPFTDGVTISIHIPSELQAEIIDVQLRNITVSEVREKPFTVCRFSSSASISNVSTCVELFCKYLVPGEWINDGHHIVEPAPSPPLPADQQDSVTGQPPPRPKRRRKQQIPVAGSQNPVGKGIKTFLDKVQTGLQRLGRPKEGSDSDEAANGDIFELCTTTRGIQADLNHIIAKLIRMKKQKSATAQRDNWKLEHLIRCIRKICRDREQLSVSDDPNGRQKKQETAASQINKVVDRLIPAAGPLALVVYSALAETKYKWAEAGLAEDIQDVEGVVIGLLSISIEVPAQLELFNPLVSVSRILREDYQTLCWELGLPKFITLGIGGNNRMFNELPLSLAMEQAQSKNNAIWIPKKDTWLLEATDGALQDGTPKKRQRQAAAVDDHCTKSNLHRGRAPTDDGSSTDLGEQNAFGFDASLLSPEIGHRGVLGEPCNTATSAQFYLQAGLSYTVSHPPGIDVLQREEVLLSGMAFQCYIWTYTI
ncbi:hypothetical protein PG989_001243 [Apiospora arundinis]